MNRKLKQKENTANPVIDAVKNSKTKETKVAIIKDISTRKNSFLINPKNIVLDFKDKNGNPRLDYGDDFEEFKSSIKQYGIQQALKLYKGDDGKWHLAHGFRRMKAVLETLEEDPTNELLKTVPFDEVANDEQQILIEHFTLNTGKPLNDVEMGEGLKRLRSLSGIENVAELARRVSMDYQKAHNLMTFIEKAGTKIKDAVSKGEVSFNVGNQIVLKAKNITEQGALLKEGKENALKTGKNKIRAKHIGKVSRDKMPFETKLQLALSEVSKIEGVSSDIINVFGEIIEAVKTNKDLTEIANLLKISTVELQHQED